MFRLLIIFLISVNSLLYCQEQLPIMAFGGVKTGKVNDFMTLKNAGFNISLDVYNSTNDAILNLKAADQAGIKLFIYSDSLMLFPDKVINQIKDYPAFYGTYVSDEPPVKHFPMIKWRIEGIKNFDKKGKFYVNLLPNEASTEQWDAPTYEDYLLKFADIVKPEFISFDFYPIKNKKVDLAWYRNLEQVRKFSLQINKPFWGFANSTVFGPYSQPTLAELKLQQFGNLLYGAKGLQYFTYWTQNEDFRIKNNFHHSIVSEDGKPTQTYDLVKQLNKQIRNLEWIFIKGVVKEVFHDGSYSPAGTRKLERLPENFKIFNKSKESVLVSSLEVVNKKFLIVQNKNIDKSISFIYNTSTDMKMLDSQTGSEKEIPNGEASAIILPGDILIFYYPN